MARPDWVVGGDRRTAAADRIYRDATDLVLTKGLDSLEVDTLAQRLNCSRATVYRHAGGKAHIRDVVLLRLASRIVDTVRTAVEALRGSERVTTAITVALKEIRSDPLRSLMVGASTKALVSELHSSPLLSHLAAELTGITDDDPAAAQWIVRIVMSLAFWPAPADSSERQLLERFVAPVFTHP
ncbi:TetR family transcriptional regulator [Mycobacterium sp. 236(2023)]|uniref:TetR/AcrR family transcriptional regulator n=1 Tax=Mycobacterium sp. 236(2023) TaxID=3038163 RepID=UPI00241515F7|nr:TetR family transcriptional regulator [Mycobacterium sp. 236(2023)]MDG4669262.1 TetR family transcriptional regulator [Mycobacterium sp. 236(2023)]